jgi:CubicO group peptidase (beta-lactamase class C family)
VAPNTLFNVFSAGKGVVAAALHVLVAKGVIDLDAPVVRYWPAFAEAAGSRARHALTKKDITEQAVPTSAPGAVSAYHYLSFGFLVGGIVRGATGKSVRQVVQEEIAGPLALRDEMFLGLPSGATKEESTASRLATLVLKRPTDSISGRPERPAADPDSAKRGPKEENDEHAGDEEDEQAERPFQVQLLPPHTAAKPHGASSSRAC